MILALSTRIPSGAVTVAVTTALSAPLTKPLTDKLPSADAITLTSEM